MKRSIKREETEGRLLEVGLSLFIQQGYHGTGLKEVVDQAQMPKGSFYAYFDSKEAFGGSVVNHFAQQGLARLAVSLEQAPDPLLGLRAFFQANRDKMESRGFAGGCLLGNFSNELGAQAHEITPHLLQGLGNLSLHFAEALEKAQELGLVRQDLDASTLGDLLLNGWEGALMRAKTQVSPEPLDQFLTSFFDHLLKP
ncbi:MAG: TetR family transcriptional regulator C-terminal domain-containing protein [bacterium]|nr:TetR family transcriptional regulator C-terminal domain-containing protein [bacterium]